MSSPGHEERSAVKRALVELQARQARIDELEAAAHEPVAVIGVGCRLPGADGPEPFWRLLQEGVDAVTDVPPDRWDADAYLDPDPETPGRMVTRRAGFLDRVDRFDAEAFGITPREAAGMDPQQRLLLEVAWEALEDAGIPADGLAGTAAGVYVGISTNDYLELRLMARGLETVDAYLATGGSHSVAAGRLSYVLGLRGPSLAVDTACSSSLVAIHLAVRALRAREADVALAGGVNVMLLPELTVALSQARMLAPDGRCKTFDARADGFVRAEGCGLVVLKRLADAEADGDDVLAVVRGTAVNQDGRTNGLTAPSAVSQEAVLRAALADAGLSGAEVDYVEAHGTGTALGDPIELQALAAAYGEGRTPGSPLAVGSVKTNLGHLEAAAGVAGFVKAVLALRHGEIPPHLHFERPNPYVPWDEIPVTIPVAGTPWPTEGRPRRAGVSSFGFGGTNAHVVLEQAPERAVDAPRHPRRWSVLCLSGHGDEALRELAGRYAVALSTTPDADLAELCAEAATGRAHLPHRLALPVALEAGSATVAETLTAVAEGREAPGAVRDVAARGERPAVAFLFTGQGVELEAAARSLDADEPVVAEALERFDALLAPELGGSVRDALRGEAPLAPAAVQPALVALQLALAELWRSWGVVPDAVLGHSAGELAAAAVAGVLAPEDALRLAAVRGRLTASVGGAMAAVLAPEEEVAPVAAECGVSVAAVNAPASVVLAGPEAALAQAGARLAQRGVEVRPLSVGYGAHSPLVEPVLDDFAAAVARVELHSPRVAYVSSLLGALDTEEVATAAYWRRHLREPVRFAAAVRALAALGADVRLELGPRPVLLALARQSWPEGPEGGVWAPSLRPEVDPGRQLAETLARLHATGVSVDWNGYVGRRPRRRLGLPTYPWQRRRHWLDGLERAPAGEDAWARTVAAADYHAERGPLDLAPDAHAEQWRALDRLALGAMTAALRGLGAFAAPGEEADADTLVADHGVAAEYRAVVARWLTALADEGLLERRDGRFVAPATLPAPDLPALAAAARERLGDPTLPDYLVRCAERVAAVLTGRESPLQLLFPAGSFATAEYLYERHALPRYLNGLARAAFDAFAAGHPQRSRLRVLELGAGTGGTTASLLPALPAGAEYWFTDVSDLFLARARGRFAAHEGVRYALLDLELDPAEQGFGHGAFDVVVATNVLHATSSLPATAERVRRLLAPGGLLVLVEATSHPRWFDVSLAVVGGWNRFADGLRRESPLVDAETWRDVLTGAGFDAVGAWPAPGSPAAVLGASVLLARAPATGVRRQSEAAVAPAPADGRHAAPEPPLVLGDGEREEALVGLVRRRVLEVTRGDAARPPGRRERLMDVGVDSLMAVELAGQLTRDLALAEPLPATLIFDHPTVEAVARHLEERLLAGTGAATPGGDEALAALSDEEVESLLVRKLEGRGSR